MNIRFSILGLLFIVLVAPSMAEGIYKWEDENGVTHYSDVPREGATEVQISPVQTFSSPEVPVVASTDGSQDEEADEDQGYTSFAISSPAQEETIWNTGGKVSVNVSLLPSLKPGHRLRLYIDGQSSGVFPEKSTRMQLEGVVRGEHVLRAEVLGRNGQVLMSSEPVTFFYQQTSVNRRPRPR